MADDRPAGVDADDHDEPPGSFLKQAFAARRKPRPTSTSIPTSWLFGNPEPPDAA